jgi:hypothetical protein
VLLFPRVVILKEFHVTILYNMTGGLVEYSIGVGLSGIANKYTFLSFGFELR